MKHQKMSRKILAMLVSLGMLTTSIAGNISMTAASEDISVEQPVENREDELLIDAEAGVEETTEEETAEAVL